MMGMYRNRMPDREMSAEMTKADYWEVQADMWHQNYKEAVNETVQLRGALTEIADMINTHNGNGDIMQEIAREALKEKE